MSAQEPKELEHLTLDQLSQVLGWLLQVRRLRRLIEAELQERAASAEKAIPALHWAPAYELSAEAHLHLFLQVAQRVPEFQQAITADQPLDALLDIDCPPPALPWNVPGSRLEGRHLLELIGSLSRSWDSLMAHGCYLNDLVAQVRAGDDDALFRAVRIDRSVLTCDSLAQRLTRAEAEGDGDFFRQLQNALRAASPVPRSRHPELGFVLALLHAEDRLDELTQDDAYYLFCDKLGLYPTSGKDPARSLWQFIGRWQKTQQSD